MAQAEKQSNKASSNPLFWVALVVIGLIIFIFLASDRTGVGMQPEALDSPAESLASTASPGEIDRDTQDDLALPGARARLYIKQIRAAGEPYPLEKVMAKATEFSTEGSLADAHLVFFFAARAQHVEAMMTMGEMSDPTLFSAENNLMDHPDPVQAYKWYRMALDKGFEPARDRLQNLQRWAKSEASYGNIAAQQLLLNFN